MDVNGWLNTRTVLAELEKLLLCDVCNQLLTDPSTLGRCEHFFCQKCVNDIKGNACPVCGVPSYVKDVQKNRQLDTAATLCQQLTNLLTAPNNAETSFEETEVKSDMAISESNLNISTAVTKTSSRQTPVSRRTRRTVRIQKKKAFIDQTNKSWGIGKAAGEACHSCKKSTQHVLFKEKGRHSPEEASRNKKKQISDKQPTSSLKKHDLVSDTVKGQSRMVQNQADSDNQDQPVGEEHKDITENGEMPNSSTNETVSSEPVVTGSNLPNVSTQNVTPKHGSKLITSTPTSSSRRSWISCMSTPLSNRLGSVYINSPNSLNKRNAMGETALHMACIKGNVERVKQLLAEGATVNTKDNAGWTPLHETCNHGNVVLTEVLLDAGALLNTPGGPDSDTPLHDAVTNGHLECVRLLVARGASITQRNLLGKTPMELAQNDEMKAALLTPVSENCKSKLPQELFPGTDIQQVIIVTTGLNREQKIEIEKCCRSLHGQMIAEFTPAVTHVVTSVNRDGMCPRTLKYLHALLKGKWIVNKQWIETCLEYKSWVSEEPFEVPGASTSPNSMAPYRARQNFLQQLPALFTGCHFYLHGDFTYPAPSRSELIELIKAGGGHIVNREPRLDVIEQSTPVVPYHSTVASQLEHCSYYIVSDKLKEGKLISPRLGKTSPAWIMDCIAHFRIVDLHR